MRTKDIVAGGVVITILLLITIVFITARPSPPTVTIHYVKSLQSSNSVLLSFEITNHSSSSCLVEPVAVEIRTGSVWTSVVELPQARPLYITSPLILRQHGAASFTQEVINLPRACPVRLRTSVHQVLEGPDGVVMRLKMRFLEGRKRVNPFDKTTTELGNSASIISDEFVEPKPQGQGASEK